MEVILCEDITGLGEEGDIIKNVKDGYARNFLIPKKLAVLNNKKNRKELEAKREEIETRKAKKREEARTIEERIKNLKLVIEKKAGENGKLFGSVTSTEIAEYFLDKGIELDKRKIEILKPIKVIGEHKVRVKLHEHIQPELTVNVVRLGEEQKTSVSEEKLEKMKEEQVETLEEEEEEQQQQKTESEEIKEEQKTEE